MARFEELQMMLVESATRHLDLYSMQVFTEQFTLDRESKIFLTLQDMESPYLITAMVSYTFDAFQTGHSLYWDENEDDEDELEPAVDTTVDLEFKINIPVLTNYSIMESLYEKVLSRLEDTDVEMVCKEFTTINGSFKEYELTYYYDIDYVGGLDAEMFDDIFKELKDTMEFIYKETDDYIDMSWYER
ncbi:MAG: hypothetical protein N3A62_09945 [Thermodesulfovibrionales bacterium]|nr:hypothetical protein [Thermodesulfovibrionales bacterium]